MNKELNKEIQNKITQTEQLITDAKLSLKSWASQISQYHKQLKTFSQQLETIKQQTTMKNENNNQGGNN